METEDYIRATRARAEQAALHEVADTGHPLGLIGLAPGIIAVVSTGLAVGGALFLQHQGRSSVVALASGLTGPVLAVVVQALRLHPPNVRGRRR